VSKIGRNDLCPCGSGKKYKKCCESLNENRERRSSLALSSKTLHEKNTALLGAMVDIFGINRPWEKVKDGMSDARIREFYTFIADLWPLDTDPQSILPEPSSSLRALYLGENEPEVMVENVFRFCLYSDQILMVNPFDNPNVMAEQYNPIHHPGEWRIQTLRLVFHLVLLSPWIAAGLVILIPDPGDFNRALRVRTWDLASERLKNNKPGKGDIDESIIKHRARETFLMSPRDYLERMTRETNPGISDEEVRRVVDSIETERANNPLLPNQTLDKMPGQYTVGRMGANLEMGMYICHATGAFPYTNVKFRWKEILGARQDLGATAQVWSPLTNAFQKLDFKFLDHVDSKFACSIRQDGRLEGLRSYLRKLWNAVGGNPDPASSETLARDFSDELTQSFNEAKSEWDAIDRDLLKWGIPKIGGVVAGSGLVTGHFSPAFAAGGFVVAGVSEIIQAEMKRREFRKRVPMSVFIDLERRKG
jgi:hypothetical protein